MDGTGRSLEFANGIPSGGFLVRYRGEADWVSARAVIALIAGRPVRIGEARFGAIIAEPLLGAPTPGPGAST